MSSHIYRVLDANFNRAKEGLRVCEDLCRFVIDSKSLTQDFMSLRRQLTQSITATGIPLARIIRERDSFKDVGKSYSKHQPRRSNLLDLFLANSGRAKESLRVLEECVKLLDSKQYNRLEDLRYSLYQLEKRAVERLEPLCYSRRRLSGKA
ncbi:MAG: thiamine-phosphate pyrophosphorylase [Candidatus Omnitrophica bacterium]|nr:thiamine-phosphate pyrophosphorylase [Candidatus Omnitrophota bacterium]